MFDYCSLILASFVDLRLLIFYIKLSRPKSCSSVLFCDALADSKAAALDYFTELITD